jgi:hypothetical protein
LPQLGNRNDCNEQTGGGLKEALLRIAEERRRARQTCADFVEGARAGDAERMVSAVETLEFGRIHGVGWAHAMRRIARLGSVPKRTREVFLRLYVTHGYHIRQETLDDLALIDGLRVLLPRYRGPAMRLYRGQGALEPRGRSYGLSWSASREVAAGHAQGLWRHCRGGSVLLEALAPPDAIICRIHADEDRYGETEYLVDRRRLRRVQVAAKYSELPVLPMRAEG